jgi:prepilin-type N-terminal cleavage/methylation domain-containing protein
MRRRGFTLIELLVVIAIMGVVLALVAPLTVERIDKMKARSELAQLRRTLSELSIRAYATHGALEIDATGTRLAWRGAKDGQLDLAHLFFTVPQHITINANGIAVPANLAVISRGSEQQLALNGWLESGSSKGGNQ